MTGWKGGGRFLLRFWGEDGGGNGSSASSGDGGTGVNDGVDGGTKIGMMHFFSVGQAKFATNQQSMAHVFNERALAHLHSRIVAARAEYTAIDSAMLNDAHYPHMPDPVLVQCLRLQEAELLVWDLALQFVETYQAAFDQEHPNANGMLLAACQPACSRIAHGSSEAALADRSQVVSSDDCAAVLRAILPTQVQGPA
jgi:hypothetical protein